MQPITLTVVDQDTSPLEGVQVEVRDAATLLVVSFSDVTPESGELVTALAAGTYTVLAFLPGYSFVAVPLTVVASPVAVEVTGEALVISPPALPGVCRLYATLLNQDGTPREGSTVSVYALPSPVHQVMQREVNKVSDADGLVEFDVVYGTPLRVTFLGRGISREIVVPDSPTADLLSLVEASADPFQPVAT